MFETSVMSNDFQRAVKLCRMITDGKKSLPILSCALITSNRPALTLTATDLECALTARLGCAGDTSEWSLAIPLVNFDGKADKDNFRLDLAPAFPDLTLHTTWQRSKPVEQTIKGFDPALFPVIPAIPYTLIALLDNVKALKQMIRYQLETVRDSVYFAVTDNTLTLTSTDGKSLHRSSIPVASDAGSKFSLSTGACKTLVKALEDKGGDLEISQGRDRVLFHTDFFDLTIMTGEKQDLDLSGAVLPDHYFYTFQVRAESFRSDIKCCRAFAESFTLVTCKGKTTASIKSEGIDGDFTSSFDVLSTLPDRSIPLTCESILDAITTMSKHGDTLTLSFNNATDPILIGVTSEAATLSAVVMPVRRDEECYRTWKRNNSGYGKEYPATSADEEYNRLMQDARDAELEYLEWLKQDHTDQIAGWLEAEGLTPYRDTIRARFGLDAHQAAQFHLYRASGDLINTWSSDWRIERYGIEEVYEYIYKGGPVPGFREPAAKPTHHRRGGPYQGQDTSQYGSAPHR